MDGDDEGGINYCICSMAVRVYLSRLYEQTSMHAVGFQDRLLGRCVLDVGYTRSCLSCPLFCCTRCCTYAVMCQLLFCV